MPKKVDGPDFTLLSVYTDDIIRLGLLRINTMT